MEEFFTFLENHVVGILLLVVLVFIVLYVVRSLAKIFGWGTYSAKLTEKKSGNFTLILGDLLVKIINDFRHLLALMLVFIFALALGYVMVAYNGSLDDFSKGLQVVVSTLGGLIGSIIGYYFGESAAKKDVPAGGVVSNAGAPVVQPAPPTKDGATAPATDGIKAVNLPEGLKDKE